MAAIAVLAYFSNQVEYFTVDQFADADAAHTYRPLASEATGPRLQLRGRVDTGTVQRPAEGLQLAFDLAGKSDRVPVVYHGIVPDTFDLAESVTVGGAFQSDGTFLADELFVQCPSKYEALPPGERAVGQNG
jgi:cytochrome c-type biogenesis protein CcmE